MEVAPSTIMLTCIYLITLCFTYQKTSTAWTRNICYFALNSIPTNKCSRTPSNSTGIPEHLWDNFSTVCHRNNNNVPENYNVNLLFCFPFSEDPGVRGRLNECLETILNKAQEPPKSKKVQHSNAKNAVLFEAISLIIHNDTEPNLLVRACNQLGQFLSNRETNLRYLALESMCLLATSEFSHEAVKKHQEVVILSMKVKSTLKENIVTRVSAACHFCMNLS